MKFNPMLTFTVYIWNLLALSKVYMAPNRFHYSCTRKVYTINIIVIKASSNVYSRLFYAQCHDIVYIMFKTAPFQLLLAVNNRMVCTQLKVIILIIIIIAMPHR